MILRFKHGITSSHHYSQADSYKSQHTGGVGTFSSPTGLWKGSIYACTCKWRKWQVDTNPHFLDVRYHPYHYMQFFKDSMNQWNFCIWLMGGLCFGVFFSRICDTYVIFFYSNVKFECGIWVGPTNLLRKNPNNKPKSIYTRTDWEEWLKVAAGLTPFLHSRKPNVVDDIPNTRVFFSHVTNLR